MNKRVSFDTFYCLFWLIRLSFYVALQLEEAVTQSSTMQCKVTQLETNLAAREQEILAYDAKYRKCVEKAKEVIKSIDPRIASGNSIHSFHKNLKCNCTIYSSRCQRLGEEFWSCGGGAQAKNDRDGGAADDLSVLQIGCECPEGCYWLETGHSNGIGTNVFGPAKAVGAAQITKCNEIKVGSWRTWCMR